MQDSLSAFCQNRGILPLRPLGQGKDGVVYETTRPSAVKVHLRQEAYARERDAYLRFRNLRMTGVFGLRIPTLFDHDDQLRTLEMSIVRPPFILDFASAWLDAPPDFPEDVMLQWQDEIQERFGAKATDVLAVLDKLAEAGVFLFDAHPHNIKFAEDEPFSA